MLRNAPLLVSALGSTWLCDMFSSLCTAVKDCKNFKVRINAALALSVPKERGFYGSTDQFSAIWQSLFVGLQNAEIVTDFSEVKYREVRKLIVYSASVFNFNLSSHVQERIFDIFLVR